MASNARKPTDLEDWDPRVPETDGSPTALIVTLVCLFAFMAVWILVAAAKQ